MGFFGLGGTWGTGGTFQGARQTYKLNKSVVELVVVVYKSHEFHQDTSFVP